MLSKLNDLLTYWIIYIQVTFFTAATNPKWAMTDEAILMKRVADG